MELWSAALTDEGHGDHAGVSGDDPHQAEHPQTVHAAQCVQTARVADLLHVPLQREAKYRLPQRPCKIHNMHFRFSLITTAFRTIGSCCRHLVHILFSISPTFSLNDH